MKNMKKLLTLALTGALILATSQTSFGVTDQDIKEGKVSKAAVEAFKTQEIAKHNAIEINKKALEEANKIADADQRNEKLLSLKNAAKSAVNKLLADAKVDDVKAAYKPGFFARKWNWICENPWKAAGIATAVATIAALWYFKTNTTTNFFNTDTADLRTGLDNVKATAAEVQNLETFKTNQNLVATTKAKLVEAEQIVTTAGTAVTEAQKAAVTTAKNTLNEAMVKLGRPEMTADQLAVAQFRANAAFVKAQTDLSTAHAAATVSRNGVEVVKNGKIVTEYATGIKLGSDRLTGEPATAAGTFGDNVAAATTCPADTCGKTVDTAFKTYGDANTAHGNHWYWINGTPVKYAQDAVQASTAYGYDRLANLSSAVIGAGQASYNNMTFDNAFSLKPVNYLPGIAVAALAGNAAFGGIKNVFFPEKEDDKAEKEGDKVKAK